MTPGQAHCFKDRLTITYHTHQIPPQLLLPQQRLSWSQAPADLPSSLVSAVPGAIYLLTKPKTGLYHFYFILASLGFHCSVQLSLIGEHGFQGPRAQSLQHSCLVLPLPPTAESAILVPRPGIKPESSALKGRFFEHWTTREIPVYIYIFFFSLIYLFGCSRSYLWHVRSSSLTRGPYIGSVES